jgi:Flp pilus assembly CpaE family ATPase
LEQEESVPKILIVDRKGELSLELVKVAADMAPAPVVLRLTRPTQLVEVVEQERPAVIVVAPHDVTKAGLRRLADVRRADPRIVILLSDNGKALSAAQAAETGASGILPAHPTRQKLRMRLARALETAEALRRKELDRSGKLVSSDDLVGTPVIASDDAVDTWSHDELPDAEWLLDEPLAPEHLSAPELAPAAPAQREAEESTEAPAALVDPAPSSIPDTEASVTARTTRARVFTVASASGGAGKTFLATNLATYLAKATGGKVLLLDLALQFGEVAVALHLRPQRTIAELLHEDDLVSALPDYLESDRGGFKVLCAPSDPLEGEKIGAPEAKAVLDAALGEFDFIVIDTLSTLDEVCLVAFDQSEVLLLLANMDLPSLKHLRTFMQTLEQLHTRAERVSLILNRAQSGGGIELDEVEEIYPERFLAVLPDAKEVLNSINTGVPLLQGNPNAEISSRLVEAFMKLVPPQEGARLPWNEGGSSRRRFARLFRGGRK